MLVGLIFSWPYMLVSVDVPAILVVSTLSSLHLFTRERARASCLLTILWLCLVNVLSLRLLRKFSSPSIGLLCRVNLVSGVIISYLFLSRCMSGL